MSFSKAGVKQSNEKVQVIVRCRPMNTMEKEKGYKDIVKVIFPNVIEIYNPKFDHMDHSKRFTFDAAYNWRCDQQELYNGIVRATVDAVLNGFNSTVFAYGQSNAGKTFTMEGDGTSECCKGVIPRACEHIFDHISQSFNMQYLVRTSYLEIYQEEIRDLLSKNNNCKYKLRENNSLGVYVEDMTSYVCKSLKEINKIIATGKMNRTTGVTDVNERSSRSHAILMITVEMTEVEGPLQSRVRVGKLYLVDLAGSERQNKTNAEGTRLKEASKINLSLSALGNVISALSNKKEQFIPYRDSKLSRLLMDSFGGNSKTLMIANISPASYNYDESLNTLRYAFRARHIKNKPYVNEDPVDGLLRKYQEEILNLKAQLIARTEMWRSQKLINGRRTKSVCKVVVCEPLIPNTKETNISSSDTNLVLNRNMFEEHEYVDNLLHRIESMESKLITGSGSFLEYTYHQQKALEAKTNKIGEIKQRESEIQELLDLQEETAEEVRERNANLQQEVKRKSKEFEEIYDRLQTAREQIYDAKEEFSRDRRNLETTESDFFKDLKLRFMIAENLIPNEARRKLLSRICFCDESDSWIVVQNENIHDIPRPISVEYMRRPVTLYTKIVQRKINHIFRYTRTEKDRKRTFRFKAENILELELVYFPRTTCVYKLSDNSAVISKFQSNFEDKRDININVTSPLLKGIKTMAYPNTSTFYQEHLLKVNKPDLKPKLYPKSRGLVKK